MLKKDHTYEQLRSDITQGKYPNGHMLPPETAFARQLGIGKVTLRAALKTLEDEMLVRRIRGKGTFVNFEPTSLSGRSVMMVYNEDFLQIPFNFCLALFREFSVLARENNFNEILMTDHEVTQLGQKELQMLIEQGNVKGIFVFPHVFDGTEPWLPKLKSCGIPVILADAMRDDYRITGCAAVTVRMKEGCRGVIRHMEKCRYRSVAALSLRLPYLHQQILEMDIEEFRNEAAYCGMACPPEFIRFIPFEAKVIQETVADWLTAAEKPEVIFCVNVAFVPIIYNVIQQYKLRIPQDIAVISFSDKGQIPIVPSLTVLDRDPAGHARKAWQIFLEADKWFPESPPNRFHFYDLVEGTSSNVHDRTPLHVKEFSGI